MKAELGQRKLIATLAALACGTGISICGMLWGLRGGELAALIAANSAPVGWFVIGSWGEWKARAADQSNLVDQQAAEKKP